MTDNHFDGWTAEHYDATVADMYLPENLDPAVDFLARLAGARPALELGIGTGRVALTLMARGVRVAGIELSPAMVDQLRTKLGGDAIDVTIGDFASTLVDAKFGLVYVVFNTINNLTTQDEQVDCFRNVAAHLEPGGCFVIEVGMPNLQRLPPGETVRPFAVTPTHIGFDEYDIATQASASHHLYKLGGQWREFSIPFRYVWPAELDLMARIAGMTLRERWADWDRTPFTSESPKHISVWERC